MRPRILIAYDATPEAADGLALGRLLANLVDGDLHVARVLPDTPSTEATDRDTQAMFHATLHETQQAAAKRLHERQVELWPVFGTPVGPGIQALAADRGADLIVLGSPHHGPSAACCTEARPRRWPWARPAPSRSPRVASAGEPPSSRA